MEENKNREVNEEFEKLEEKELDDVAGGKFGQDADCDDGHEKSCFAVWHDENECKSSPDGYHYWEKDYPHLVCKYCGDKMKPYGV